MLKKILCVTVILITIIFGGFGCLPERKLYVTEHFKYYEIGLFKEYIAIDGFTDKGKELESVVIPEEINMHKVIGLGSRHKTDYFNSQKLKKIYINTNIEWIHGDFLKEKDVEVMFIRISPYFHLEYESLGTGTLYVPSTYVDQFKNAQPANVSFMYNYEGAPNGGYYWIDNIEVGEKLNYDNVDFVFRKDGDYFFKGWYTEPECINKWDLENGIAFPEDSPNEQNNEETDKELILYARWKRIGGDR